MMHQFTQKNECYYENDLVVYDMSQPSKHNKPKCDIFLILLTLILGLASFIKRMTAPKFLDLEEYIKPTSAPHYSISTADEQH